MSFSFDLQLLTICLLGASALCTIIIVAIYCPFIRRVASRQRACSLNAGGQALAPTGYPAASVIVYSQDEAARLENFLPEILGQDYPGEFEVIVVNEGDSGDVRNAVGALQLAHRNLYLTFTPDGARSLSRKKLALTLGIKAARHEIVVLTTVDAIISSDKWLSKIMRHFSDEATGIVLGYAAPEGKVSRMASFAFTADSVAWLSSAIGRRPFRGSELNLAYRRSLFFANKGFSRSLNLHAGDDDIFVSEIAGRDSTVVELSPESIVHFGSYDVAKTLRDSAVRHEFTRRFIRHRPLSRLGLGESAMWLGMASSAAAVISDPLNATVTSAATALFVISVIEIARSWRKACTALDMRRLTLTAPLFAVTRPFYRLTVAIRARLSHQKRYTWD